MMRGRCQGQRLEDRRQRSERYRGPSTETDDRRQKGRDQDSKN
jgi:hypothetical protein